MTRTATVIACAAAIQIFLLPTPLLALAVDPPLVPTVGEASFAAVADGSGARLSSSSVGAAADDGSADEASTARLRGDVERAMLALYMQNARTRFSNQDA